VGWAWGGLAGGGEVSMTIGKNAVLQAEIGTSIDERQTSQPERQPTAA
jgi:hypothetical protein